MLVVFLFFVILFVLGLGMILAQNNSVTGLVPTQEPWQLTITSIMDNRTAYAKLYPSPTLTPLPAFTATHEVFGTLDPLEMTATYIVGEATDAAAIEFTNTASAIFGIEPITTGTLMPTSVPTYTVAELTQQKKAYLNKLTTTVGFNHPIFDDIANSLIVEEVQADRYLDLSELTLELKTTSFANTKYVVLIIHHAGYEAGFDRLVLFRLANQQPILLDNPLSIPVDSLYYLFFDEQGFTDWNGNGLPDIAVYVGRGGSCCAPWLEILEIKPNNQIVDISPQPTKVYPARFEDLNHDGIPEIKGLEPRSGISSVDLVLWFGWDGQQYVNVSAQYPELYMPRIQTFIQKLTSVSDCRLKSINRSDSSNKVVIWDVEIENFLADYYAIGHLLEGWSDLQRLLKVNCSDGDLQTYGKWLTTIEKWVNLYSKP